MAICPRLIVLTGALLIPAVACGGSDSASDPDQIPATAAADTAAPPATSAAAPVETAAPSTAAAPASSPPETAPPSTAAAPVTQPPVTTPPEGFEATLVDLRRAAQTVDVDAAFRDEFDAPPSDPWIFVNEDPDRWTMVDTGLQLTAGDQGIGPGSGEIVGTNVLMRATPDPVTGDDYAVQTHVFVEPNENFEQAGVFLLIDGDSYVSLVVGFCQPCNVGRSVFLETPDDGGNMVEGLQSIRVPNGVDQMTLRLETSPDAGATVAMVSWGPDEGDWQQLGPVIRHARSYVAMGVQAANLPGPDASERDLVAVFDSFELVVYE